MTFFDSLFGKSKKKECPHIKFGRFSDHNKAPEKYKAWDQAELDFREGKFLESLDGTLFYLKNEHDDNITYSKENGAINFSFFQGSKKIIGYTKGNKIYVESKIVRSTEINIGLMRYMLEKNYDLQYSKFATNSNGELVIKMTFYLSDASPYRVYYGLKELAINADREDDRMLDEFKSLTPINNEHLVALTETEKDIKYKFIHEQIDFAFNAIDSSVLNFNELPISSSYLLLSVVYKLDYLIRPEGFVMKTLDKCHYYYYTQNGYSTNKKNHKIRQELSRLKDRDKESVYLELYNVISSFSVNNPISHAQLVEFIDGELGNFDWYYNNKYYDFALGIPDFIVGFNLFNFTIPKVDREMFHLYYRVTNQKIFHDLGFEELFEIDGIPNQKIIINAIKEIAELNLPTYPNLKINYSMLSFKDIPSFAKSLLLMIRTFDLFKPNV